MAKPGTVEHRHISWRIVELDMQIDKVLLGVATCRDKCIGMFGIIHASGSDYGCQYLRFMEPVAQTSNAELVDGREELGRVGDDLDGNCVHCCGQVTLMNKCHL